MGTPSDRMAKMAQEAMKAKPAVEKLIIEMHPGGGVAVNGPIHNKILCFGMLKAAEFAIAQYDPKKQNQIVIPKIVMDGKPKG